MPSFFAPFFSQDVSALLRSIHATPAPAVADAAATETVTEVTEVVRGRRMAAPCTPGAFEAQRLDENRVEKMITFSQS